MIISRIILITKIKDLEKKMNKQNLISGPGRAPRGPSKVLANAVVRLPSWQRPTTLGKT